MKRQLYCSLLVGMALIGCEAIDGPGESPVSPIEVGALELDPPTLRSFGLSLPVRGDSADYDATAQVEFRKQGEPAWRAGLPLMRIRPEFADHPRGEAFAGSILGLEEDTAYEIRVTVTDPDGGDAVRRISARTRSLPKAEPEGARVLRVGTSEEFRAALLRASPGQVITLAPGDYPGDFVVAPGRGGTPRAPLFIRGQDRDSVVIKALDSVGFSVLGDHVVLEDLTIDMSLVSNRGATATGVLISNSKGAVVRRTKISNADNGIVSEGSGNLDFTIYDNILSGRNAWPAIDLSTWPDEGIAVSGAGHAVFHNTLSGFGDALGLVNDPQVSNRAIDIYLNDVLWTADDGLDLGEGERNIRAWENRVLNSATLVSIQPKVDKGGPIYAFRNMGINQARRPFKLNDGPSGFLLLHNTAVKSLGIDPWLWTQYANGAIENFQIKNNLLASTSPNTIGSILFDAQSNHADVDYNGYLIEADFWLSRRPRHEGYRIYDFDNNGVMLSNPIFAQPVALGEDYRSLAKAQDLSLHADAQAVDAGAQIPGINGGFRGDAPDLGALEYAAPVPAYGARIAP